MSTILPGTEIQEVIIGEDNVEVLMKEEGDVQEGFVFVLQKPEPLKPQLQPLSQLEIHRKQLLGTCGKCGKIVGVHMPIFAEGHKCS